MENPAAATRTHEEACGRVAAHFRQRWLRHYVGSKLRSDPVFAAAFDLLRDSEEPILDVGCGVGLLAFYLRARGCRQPIAGLDVDGRKIRQACAAARDSGLEFSEHDVRNALPAFRGNVAIFDLLHYLEPARQETLLRELGAFVPPGGRLVLRDCPRDGSLRYWLTRAGEVFAQTISWNWKTPLHFPSRSSIQAAFPEEEFNREETPSWGRTPFNNRLFVFQRKPISSHQKTQL